MALLNWGNALSQAGKGMATVGLEGVKATMEQDKIRLAADLAAKNEEASDARRATTAIDLANLQGSIAATAAGKLADVNTDTAAARVTADINSALALADTPEAKARVLASNALTAKANWELEGGRVERGLQNQLAAVKDTDPNAEARRADLTRQIAAHAKTGASINLDKTGAISLVNVTGAEVNRASTTAATLARAYAATVTALAPDQDLKDQLSEANLYVAAAQRAHAGAIGYAVDMIPGFKPPAAPPLDPGVPAPGAGTGTATPEASDKRDTLPDGTPITEALSGPGRVLRAVGVGINKAVTAYSDGEMDKAIAEMAPTYKAAADEINKGIENSTKKGATLPLNYRKNLRVLLSTPEYRGYLSPAAVAVAERFKAQDEAGLSKPGTPVDLNKYIKN